MAQRQPTTSQNTLERRVRIINELGLHARAAAKIVALAVAAKGTVRITIGDQQADASDILDLMGMGAGVGTMIHITVTDPADAGILTQLAALVETGFGE